MNRKYLLIALLIITSFTGRAQTQYLDWADYAHVTTGSGPCQPYGLTVDRYGNVYTTGYFRGTVDFDPGGSGVFTLTSASEASYIKKLDASGNVIWVKLLAGYNIARSIAVDSMGNIYVTGEFSGTTDFDPGPGTSSLTSAGSSGFDIFLVKLDSAGDFRYAKQVNNGEGQSVVADPAGNVYFGGYFEGTQDLDPNAGVYSVNGGIVSGFVVKLDSAGNFDWAKCMGVPVGPTARSGVVAMAVDHAGVLYVTGNFSDTVDIGSDTMRAPSGAGYTSKIDGAGTFMWSKEIGGSSVAVDPAGNVLLTGSFTGTIDLDPGPGTFFITCTSTTGFQSGFVDKLNSSGQFVWGCLLGSSDIVQSYFISTDQGGNVYSTGLFRNVLNVDPHGTHNLNCGEPSSEIYVSKLDSNGYFASASQSIAFTLSRSVSMQSCGGIAVDAQRNIYVAGIIQGQFYIDTALGNTFNIMSGTAADEFVEKLYQYKYGADTAANCNSYTLGSSTYTASGAYLDTIVTTAGIDSIVSLSLTINTAPAAGAITGSDTLCFGHTVTLADTATGGAWSVYNSNASVSGGVVTGNTIGVDSVYYTVTNSCGSNRAALPVYIENCDAGIANATAAAFDMQVAPNPNTGNFSLAFTSGMHDHALVAITNMIGQTVKTFTAQANSMNEVTLNVPPGVYLLSASDGDGVFTTHIAVTR